MHRIDTRFQQGANSLTCLTYVLLPSQVDCGSSCSVSPQDARSAVVGRLIDAAARAAKSGDAAAMAQLEQGQLHRDVCQLLKAGLAADSGMPEAAPLQ